MALNQPIFTKLRFAPKNFKNKSRAEFHENLANNLVQDARSQTGGQTDVASPKGDCSFPPLGKRGLRSSGTLRSYDWLLLTDVSGKPIGPVFNCQSPLTLEVRTDWVSRKVGM